MTAQKILSKFRVIIGYSLRATHSLLLVRWILFGLSQPITVSQKPAIIFAPHQDDETLGCGGLIALKRALEVPVKVVFLTDGRYGKIQSIKSEDIINIRKLEAMDALNILGVAPSEINFLDQTDGSLQHLSDEQRQHLIKQLAQILTSFMPEEVYVTHRTDGLADHDAAYQLVEAAIATSGIQAELFQYPIWIFWQNPLTFNPKPKEIASAYRLSIHSVQDKKRRAIETYKSQLPMLIPGFLRRFFLPYEIFFKP